jgi:hypothetical protein
MQPDIRWDRRQFAAAGLFEGDERVAIDEANAKIEIPREFAQCIDEKDLSMANY